MLDQGKRDRARDLSLRGEIALTRLDHTHAAKLFGEAADAFPQSDREELWGAHMRRADALSDRGAIFLDSPALRNAVSIYRDVVLPLVPPCRFTEGVADGATSTGV